jgi:hypothetical protein
MSATQSDTSGQYIVTVDNSAPVVVDGYTDSHAPTCGFGWSAFGLQDADHTVVVTTLGQSPRASANGAVAPTFELDGFVWVTILSLSRLVVGACIHVMFNFQDHAKVFKQWRFRGFSSGYESTFRDLLDKRDILPRIGLSLNLFCVCFRSILLDLSMDY